MKRLPEIVTAETHFFRLVLAAGYTTDDFDCIRAVNFKIGRFMPRHEGRDNPSPRGIRVRFEWSDRHVVETATALSLSLSPFPEGSLTRQVAVPTQANVQETATDGERGRRRRARADLTRLIMISSPPNKPLAGFDLI